MAVVKNVLTIKREIAMDTRKLGVSFVAVLCSAFLSSQSPAGGLRGVPAQAPFVSGQIAVYATPEELVGAEVLKVLPHAGITIIAVPHAQEEVVARHLRIKGMQAGVNRVVQAFEVPNDRYYVNQWHLTAIQSEDAWDLTSGGGVTVAVVDTGLARGGSDGIGCVSLLGLDVVNQDNDPDDGDGHGTHVSGTVAQTTNNAEGTAGMAHGACVLPIKALGDDGSGTTADIAEAIVYAVDVGAEVINMSLGINAKFDVRSDPIMDPALDYADDHGVTVVCAAGNERVSTNVGYPAIYPTTIAVGATDAANNLARYSNSGVGLDLVAPGGDVGVDLNGDGFGDGILQETRVDGTWGYYFYQGTSMASPHVAAVAGMLIAEGVATTPTQVYDALTSSALDLGLPGYDSVYGYGLVQAYSALTGGSSEPPDACTDVDADGVCLEDGDCNDRDPTIYPGAFDSRNRRDNDGVDNDCDGVADR